jgi:hypothetical protein
MALNDKALQVSLIISQWTARKYDKKISNEVEENHNAKDAGRYNKLLISKEKLQKIQKAVGKLRNFHYINTLPWGDNGERMLPSANYFTYVNELRVLESEFNEVVKEFLANYDHYVDDARNTLGDMFNINDYPTKNQVTEKFGVKVVRLPIPNNDFRVDLGEEEIAKLKTAMEAEITDRITYAMKDAWSRVKEVLVAMKDKLNEKDAIFRNSLFGNVEDLVNVLPKLNVTDDPKINEICEDMKTLIVDPDTVRKDQTIRSMKAQQVENLMDKFKDFF